LIKVIDSIMGSGKTNWAIQHMNENPYKKFIYLAPILDEAQRIKENCPTFEVPEEYTESGEKCFKLDSFHNLLKQGKNIASTHALFKLTTDETIKYLQKWNYTLVMDEALQAVNVGDIKVKTLEYAMRLELVEIDPDTKMLIWKNEEDHGGDEFRNLRIMCKTNSVYVIEGKTKRKNVLIWIFPPVIFHYFADVWVLTYLFDCQPLRYYFDMHKLPFTKWRIDGGRLVEHVNFIDDLSTFKINIYEGNKNDIGTVRVGNKKNDAAYYYLSKGWYDKATGEQLKRIKDNIYGYFFNDLNRNPSDLNLWTCYQGDKEKYKKQLLGNGYTRGFLACNAKGTNDFRHKTAIAYPINVFLNPVIVDFFSGNGINEYRENKSVAEQYALSEMLQFLWRSGLREGKEVNLYIPSCRMRGLLKTFLGIPSTDSTRFNLVNWEKSA